MTEKRFNFNLTLGEDEHKGIVFDNGKMMKTIDVVYLLNKLLKENKQLKHDLKLYENNNTNEVLNNLRIELTSRLNDCIEEYKI